MGGGDLNLKKSWDPRRLDNKEEKWKREEQDKTECCKMKKLLAERRAEQSMEEMRRQGEGVLEKRKDRVDWMYKGPEAHTNPDDYLLGKKVDKAILEIRGGHTQNSEGGFASTSTILGGSASSALDAKDMARKMREDPLFAIKKRELNNRKELVNNPIRMKQLQQMLQTQVGKDKKKSKKAKRHKEKKEKKHKKSASTSDESINEDNNVALGHSRKRHQHYQRFAERGRVKHHKGQSRRKHEASDLSSESDSDDATSGRDRQRVMSSLDPARMKKLLEQEMLKKQPRHQSVSDSSSSDSDIDEKSSPKRKSKNSRHQSGRENFEEEQSHEHKHNQTRKKTEQDFSPRKSKRRSVSEEEVSPVKYGLQRGARSLRSESPPERQHRDHSRHKQSSRHEHDGPSQKSQHRRRENRSASPPPRHGDRHPNRDGYGRGDKHRGERNRSRSPHKRSADKYKRSQSRSPPRRNDGQKSTTAKRKLTAEEMERKRAEMMDNAKWRDEQRKERVKIYEKEEKAEAEMEKKKAKNAEFVQPLKLPDNSSVEDRIHRNIYNIQRTNAALDKNFAKR